MPVNILFLRLLQIDQIAVRKIPYSKSSSHFQLEIKSANLEKASLRNADSLDISSIESRVTISYCKCRIFQVETWILLVS